MKSDMPFYKKNKIYRKRVVVFEKIERILNWQLKASLFEQFS
jgi:hypothetical protein